MPKDIAEHKLKNLIVIPTCFNIIYGTLGAIIACLTTSFLSSNTTQQHLWLTIAIPPVTLSRNASKKTP